MGSSVKSRVLEALERHRGEYVSGGELASSLGTSRTSIWKTIQQLKQEGCGVEAVTNKGYRLLPESALLSLEGLLPYLHPGDRADLIHILPRTASTNLEAKRLALEGAAHGTVVIADTQTQGRGRQGRSFFSPPGQGLYLSAVLRLEGLTLMNSSLVTMAAAVAVCRSVQAVTGRDTGIKWVNDILLDGKKLCGILTEAITDFESGGVECAVIGTGINLTTRPEDFPPELRDTAISLLPGSGDGALRGRLAAELIHQLRDITLSKERFLEEYRRRCAVSGRSIQVSDSRGEYPATALEVGESGELIVENESRERIPLRSGEARIRFV